MSRVQGLIDKCAEKEMEMYRLKTELSVSKKRIENLKEAVEYAVYHDSGFVAEQLEQALERDKELENNE